jgi:hypothetical protein
MSWVYLKSEPGLWTVGFYDPNGTWHSHGDFDARDSAADEVARLNGGNAPRLSRGPDLLDKLLTSQDRIKDLERHISEFAYHNCFESVFGAKPVDVCSSPDDPRFGDDPPEVLFRVERCYDSGDYTVGIGPTDTIVLAGDQKGTWLEGVIESRAVNCHDDMCREFLQWKRDHGIEQEGDAMELLNWMYEVRRGDAPIGYAGSREAIQWLNHFIHRWDSAGWV